MVNPNLFDDDLQRSVDSAIDAAKEAAAEAGVLTALGATADPDEAEREALYNGRTSFAFELSGLENAAAIGEIEKALESLAGVHARIVYSSQMAWITALRNVEIAAIVEVFTAFGVTATLTESSLQRRLAWSDVEEGRYTRFSRQYIRRHRYLAV